MNTNGFHGNKGVIFVPPLSCTPPHLAALPSQVAKAKGGIAAAKAAPGGMEQQLEQMAAFANNLQEQLAITEKERDSANAKARIASLASAVKAKKAVDNYKANPTGAGADDSKACTVQ